MYWKYLVVETRPSGEYADPNTGRWSSIDKLGREGWELVTSYVEMYQVDRQQMRAMRVISTFKQAIGGYKRT